VAELVDDVHDCVDAGGRMNQETESRKHECHEEHDCMDAGVRTNQETESRTFESDRAGAFKYSYTYK